MPKIVPDIVQNQTIVRVRATLSVRDAAQLMAHHKIAAVVICNADETLAGIMTERDVTVRVIAQGLDPVATPVGHVMTPSPDTLTASDRPSQALRMMRERNYRHIPVVDDKNLVVGMVSVRDLYAFVQTELESDLRQHESYIYGESYGATVN